MKFVGFYEVFLYVRIAKIIHNKKIHSHGVGQMRIVRICRQSAKNLFLSAVAVNTGKYRCPTEVLEISHQKNLICDKAMSRSHEKTAHFCLDGEIARKVPYLQFSSDDRRTRVRRVGKN